MGYRTATMKQRFTRASLILVCLILSSCEGFDLVGKTSLPGLSSPDEGKKFLVEALNYWVGRSKEERIRVFGAPTQCTKLNTGHEVCEWKNEKQQVAFNFDPRGVASSWSYRGEYGRFNNANHGMVKAQSVSSKPSQQATEWVHPTRAKAEYPQAILECQSQIMNDPTNTSINTVRGPISGGKVQNQVLLGECLRKNGWVQK
jgi:hypothetical protein